jgi:hypothetical protein
VVEACKKVRDWLLLEGYVGAHDVAFAKLLAIVAEEAGGAACKLERLLYDEAVRSGYGYWRYIRPGGDVLFFVSISELLDLLHEKREVRVLW